MTYRGFAISQNGREFWRLFCSYVGAIRQCGGARSLRKVASHLYHLLPYKGCICGKFLQDVCLRDTLLNVESILSDDYGCEELVAQYAGEIYNGVVQPSGWLEVPIGLQWTRHTRHSQKKCCAENSRRWLVQAENVKGSWRFKWGRKEYIWNLGIRD